MSLIVFERTPLDPDIEGTDVVLQGELVSVDSKKTSKNGKEYVKCVLSATEYDPELEMETQEEATVLFFNTTSEKYGDSFNADAFEKKKFKKGYHVIIRAQKTVDKDENGEEKTTYFGTRADYQSGAKFEFRFGKRGQDAAVICGPAILGHTNPEKEGDETKPTLSVPVSMWDKDARENYSAWARVGVIDDATAKALEPTETYTDKEGNERPRRKTVAVVYSGKLTEQPDVDNSNRIAAFTGKVEAIKAI